MTQTASAWAGAAASLLVLLGCAGCSDGGDGVDGGAAPGPSSASSSDGVSGADLATLLDDAVDGGDADVRIDAIRDRQVTARGTASFDGRGPSLTLDLDFVGVPGAGRYVVTPRATTLEVPQELGLSVPEGPSADPFGPLFPDVDPAVVAALLADDDAGARVTVSRAARGGTAYDATVDARPALREIGFDLSGIDPDSLPDTVRYEVVLDGEGRLTSLGTDLQMFGSADVAFRGWR